MPAELRAHLLYPPDLLGVQTGLLGRYHVDDAETLFNGTQRWSPSAAAGAGVGAGRPGRRSRGVAVHARRRRRRSAAHWVAVMPFSPGAGAGTQLGARRLAAIGVADHDDPERLALSPSTRRRARRVATPLVAQSAIDADPDLARAIHAAQRQRLGGAVRPDDAVARSTTALVWVRPIIVTGTARRRRPGSTAWSQSRTASSASARTRRVAFADAVSPSPSS